MLYWLLPSPQKLKSNRLAMKEGGLLEVAGGNWGRPGSSTSAASPSINSSTFPRQHRPKDLNILQHVTFTSRSSTVRTLDRRTSWAPRRNSKKALLHPSRGLCCPPSFWVLVAPSSTITRWSLKRAWVLVLRELRACFQASCSFCQLRCQTCPYQTCPFTGTIIISHQETVSNQACNPPDPH